MRTTPITLLARRHAAHWGSLSPQPDAAHVSPRAQTVADHIRQHGASFFEELVEGTGLLRSQVEEALAELVALGLVTSDDHRDIVLAEYEGYARNALVQLRRIREGTQIEEDHMRNRQMIVRWLMANSKAIDVRERDGKTFYVMVDAKAFNEGVGRLLAEVQRIKAEGDYEASKKLFETYGVHFDGKLRDEVVARVEKLNMPSYTGFVQPKLEPVRDPDGTVRDVKISYPLDLSKQMLEYSEATSASRERFRASTLRQAQG
ncbi:MAG: dipeptidyl-peptidase 3 family protein [Burkholderiales bacterium]